MIFRLSKGLAGPVAIVAIGPLIVGIALISTAMANDDYQDQTALLETENRRLAADSINQAGQLAQFQTTHDSLVASLQMALEGGQGREELQAQLVVFKDSVSRLLEALSQDETQLVHLRDTLVRERALTVEIQDRLTSYEIDTEEWSMRWSEVARDSVAYEYRFPSWVERYHNELERPIIMMPTAITLYSVDGVQILSGHATSIEPPTQMLNAWYEAAGGPESYIDVGMGPSSDSVMIVNRNCLSKVGNEDSISRADLESCTTKHWAASFGRFVAIVNKEPTFNH